jgi:hypothetical protein
MPDARSIHRRLMERQRAWADAHGIELASDTSLARWRDNLLAPVSRECERALDPAVGSPTDEPQKPGRLHDLGSGLALAHNVFEPWQGRESELAARATWLCDEGARIRFAASLGRSSATDPADQVADVLIAGGSAPPTLIVPLFCETFDAVDPRPRDPLGRDATVFGDLHGCALLARDLHCHPRRFGRLDVGRVLEAALAARGRFGRHGFRVAVIWFDAGGQASRRFRNEFARVRMRIGGEVQLVLATWQDVIAALPSSGRADAGTLGRIRARYAPEATREPAPGTIASPRSSASPGGAKAT